MDCTDIKVILSGLVDDEVDRETRHEAERHLTNCAACRTLLSEAEALNAMITADSRTLAPSRALPEGFEAAVLGRTVYADGLKFNGRRWTSWMGWMAAAAVLGVSTMIAVLDRRSSNDQLAGNDGIEVSDAGLITSPYRTGTTMRSQVFDGDLSASLASHVPSKVVPAINTAPANPRTTLTMDDVDHLLTQASILMEILESADPNSYEDIEFIRRTCATDNLLRQLAEMRPQLDVDDREPVLAVEFVLTRIESGRLDMRDVQMMQDLVARMDLARRIRDMTSRAAGEFSA